MDDERDVQDWFERSTETLPPEPFTQSLLSKVRRRERLEALQRYAAILVAVFSGWLLLTELVAPLETVAAFPLVVAEVGGETWPIIVLLLIALAWRLIRYTRRAGFLRKG